jgi:DNA-3-methyladenine glycosylase
MLPPTRAPRGETPGSDDTLFDLDTITVARQLLTYALYVVNPDGSRCGGVIVETEAYLADDAASHSFRGRTGRNASMFLPAGHAYVYRSYGIHWCVNVVTAAAGIGEAVLIRALEPRQGIPEMYRRRGIPVPPPGSLPDRRLTNGPGKLCQALGITGDFDGHPLETGGRGSKHTLAEQMNSHDAAAHPRLLLIPESHEGASSVGSGSTSGVAGVAGVAGGAGEILVGPRVGITRGVEQPLRFRRGGNRWAGR